MLAIAIIEGDLKFCSMNSLNSPPTITIGTVAMVIIPIGECSNV